MTTLPLTLIELASPGPLPHRLAEDHTKPLTAPEEDRRRAKVAIVLADDFEDSEMRSPFHALERAGHWVTIVGSEAGHKVSGKRHRESVIVEMDAEDAGPELFDALVIPGGYSPDKLRLDPEVVRFTREMVIAGRTVAAICHGPQLLIEADVLGGRTLTSWPSVRRDVENAGGIWVDRPAVEDRNLITARKPEDLDEFNAALLAALARRRSPAPAAMR